MNSSQQKVHCRFCNQEAFSPSNNSILPPVWRCSNIECRAIGKKDKYGDIVFVIKRAIHCSLCHSPADRIADVGALYYQCTNPDCEAIGDPFVGIFSQLSYERIKKQMEDHWKTLKWYQKIRINIRRFIDKTKYRLIKILITSIDNIDRRIRDFKTFVRREIGKTWFLFRVKEGY